MALLGVCWVGRVDVFSAGAVYVYVYWCYRFVNAYVGVGGHAFAAVACYFKFYRAAVYCHEAVAAQCFYVGRVDFDVHFSVLYNHLAVHLVGFVVGYLDLYAVVGNVSDYYVAAFHLQVLFYVHSVAAGS